MALILAHDLGTTGDKASLYDEDGRLVASTSQPYPTDYGADGKAEQDAEAWWAAIAGATGDLVEAAGVTPAEVACLCLSGQMSGAVLVDQAGRPVRPAIIWADTRAQAECDQLIDRVGLERCYAITGHRLNATYTLEKCMWVRAHEPSAWSRARGVLLAKDHVAWRLTGRMATEPSDASGTNAFDQLRKEWSTELLEAAGIEPSLLPEIVDSTTILGGLTPEAAKATGLFAGTRVVIGGGDGPCANVGAGAVSPSAPAYTYLGSSAWVSIATDRPLHDPLMRSMTFNHVVPGLFAPTATMQAGGASLEWIGDVLAPGRAPGSLERLVEAAAGVEAADEGLFFLPYLLGERSPHWDPRVRGAFLGLAKNHGPAHLVRAVLEGVGFNLLSCLAAFEEYGRAIPTVDAIGGGARSETWLQILADAWGRPVRRRSLVDEANSLGAAIVGGVAVGFFPGFEVAERLSEIVRVFEPDAARHARYAERYPEFLEAYQRIAPQSSGREASLAPNGAGG